MKAKKRGYKRTTGLFVLNLILAFLLGCTEDFPGRSRPYIYNTNLWGEYTLWEVRSTSSSAPGGLCEGSGTLVMTGFGADFEESYSFTFTINVPTNQDTLTISHSEEGTFYLDELEHSDGTCKEYLKFFPSNGNEWSIEAQFYYGQLWMPGIEADGISLDLIWNKF